MKRILYVAIAACCSYSVADAQETGNLSGNLMLNANFFQRDTTIGAAGNPLYDNLLSGGESWMSLRYTGLYGFDAFLRVDALHNSNLKNPTQPLSGFGIGAWSLSKEIMGLQITAGYIYDQIGSGILFRAYEDRGLMIDNALAGVRLKYNITPDITVKAFTGQQKNVFERYQPIIKGLNFDGGFTLNENTFLAPGFGVLNRTLDRNSVDDILTRVNLLPTDERFSPKFNMYAFTVYNTLSYKDLSWYIEGAYKTEEAINDLSGNIFNADGNVLFTTINYATKGIALTLTGKRTENFAMRTSPSQVLLNGMANWQPIIAQIRPQRVIARYSPASQDLSEIGGSANLLISPSFDYDFNLSYTHINTLDNLKLYREVWASASIRSIDKWLIDVGVQYLEYNQEFYQVKPDAGILKAITPFTEIVYRINNRQSHQVPGPVYEYQTGLWKLGFCKPGIRDRP
ncbi:MAG: hypothetical protein KL787_03950 [Taibaiella sp.]|nr:hypothetical protein [Taibaiella sp.]